MFVAPDDDNVTEHDVQLAWQTQMGLVRQKPHPTADMHGLVQQFGISGTPLQTPVMAIMPITKRCRLVEWTLDSPGIGNCGISLQWSNWQVPRVYANLTGVGVAPTLVDSPNAGGTCDGWNPLTLNRRDAILISVDSADLEQLTLVLYVRELDMNMLGGSGA